MNNKKLVGCLFFLAVFSGCASNPLLLEHQLLPSQNLLDLDNSVAVESRRTHTVLFGIGKTIGSRGEDIDVMLSVLNGSDTPLDIAVTGVTAFDDLGAPYSVLTSDQVLSELAKKYKSDRIAIALQAFGNGAGGGQSQAKVSGQVNGTPYSGTATVTDYQARAEEGRRIQEEADSIHETFAHQVSDVRQNYFSTATLDPGSHYIGWLRLRPTKKASAERVTLTVTTGDESHDFAIKLIELR